MDLAVKPATNRLRSLGLLTVFALGMIGFQDACLNGVARAREEAETQPPRKGPQFNEMAQDRDIFHYLLENHKDISRSIKKLENGVETITESLKPEITKKIQEHAASMHERVKKGNGIRLRDPLFAEIFKHYDQIEMKIEKTEKGVKVIEISKNAEVVKLIQEHAEVVSKFVKEGFAEAHREHPVPKTKK